MEADFQHERGERLELAQRLEKDLQLFTDGWFGTSQGLVWLTRYSKLCQAGAGKTHFAGASAGDSMGQ